ncbi:FecR family protein [Sesbania bispinosa]|nr:FecR family protein [Sesbania bispinosa]
MESMHNRLRGLHTSRASILRCHTSTNPLTVSQDMAMHNLPSKGGDYRGALPIPDILKVGISRGNVRVVFKKQLISRFNGEFYTWAILPSEEISTSRGKRRLDTSNTTKDMIGHIIRKHSPIPTTIGSKAVSRKMKLPIRDIII